MDHQQANRQGGQCRLLEGCPHEERRVHSREQERQERIEGHEEGGVRARRSSKSFYWTD